MGGSFDKKEFKRNVVGSVAYDPLLTVALFVQLELCISITIKSIRLWFVMQK